MGADDHRRPHQGDVISSIKANRTVDNNSVSDHSEPVNEIEVSINFESDKNHTFGLAQQMLVNSDADHFYIRFFQVAPPPVLIDKADVSSISITGKFVSGLAIPVQQMPAIINALVSSVHKHEQLSGQALFPASAEGGENDDSDD